jgi:predicted kinase
MRQFPQGNLFSNRLAAGRIGPADVVALARALADHHAGARTDRVIAEFATPERVRRAVDDVYAAAGRYVGGPLQPRARYEQTRAFTDAFLREFADLLRARAAAGRVRECHGDVHLGNVCLDAGRVLLIDCIEFSEALRFLDVMNDAAFPAMDLRATGRADLATLFVNAYAESTGDWEGLRVLPFYLCSRAYVRAMVYSLLSDEPGLRPDQVSHARAEAERYYGLAWEYTRPSQGRLLLVCGAPGSGKSTVACELAQRAGAIHIRSDAVRKHLAGVPLHARAGAELYVPAMTRRTYARLLELGVMLAGAGFRVILDATFNRLETRGQAVARARTLGIDVRILRCVAPAEVMRARVAERRGDVSDATPQLLDRSPASFDSLTPDEERRARRVNTTREFDRGDLARWAFAEDAVSGSSEV